MEHYACMPPATSHVLSPEERHQVYNMLGLTIEVSPDGSLDIRGVLKDSFVSGNRDERADVVLSTGPRGDPHVRLLDQHRKVRGSFELGAYGEPALHTFDQENAESRSANALDRVAEGGSLYHAILFSAALILGGVRGAWIATAASAVSGSLVAAFITGVALVALVALLVVVRRRGW